MSLFQILLCVCKALHHCFRFCQDTKHIRQESTDSDPCYVTEK